MYNSDQYKTSVNRTTQPPPQPQLQHRHRHRNSLEDLASVAVSSRNHPAHNTNSTFVGGYGERNPGTGRIMQHQHRNSLDDLASVASNYSAHVMTRRKNVIAAPLTTISNSTPSYLPSYVMSQQNGTNEFTSSNTVSSSAMTPPNSIITPSYVTSQQLQPTPNQTNQFTNVTDQEPCSNNMNPPETITNSGTIDSNNQKRRRSYESVLFGIPLDSDPCAPFDSQLRLPSKQEREQDRGQAQAKARVQHKPIQHQHQHHQLSNSKRQNPQQISKEQEERQKFVVFMYILYKNIDESSKIELKSKNIKIQVTNIVKECTSRLRLGIQGYSPFVPVIKGKLQFIEGIDQHWNKANQSFDAFWSKRALKISKKRTRERDVDGRKCDNESGNGGGVGKDKKQRKQIDASFIVEV